MTAPGKVTLVRVDLPDQQTGGKLESSNFDVMTERPGSAQILLYGPKDEARLRSAGFTPRLEVADVAAANKKARDAEEAKAKQLSTDPALKSRLPTGRVSYRTLKETNQELARIAFTHPDRVRLFLLPHRSLLGQKIWGIEISNHVWNDANKPAFLLAGMHHAREWPTVDLSMEFAWDVLQHDGRDPRITSLLNRARMIVVPIVNPDGYDMSRSLINEQKRKNCRIVAGQIPTRAQCADPANIDKGVDPNRNYAAFWGGPGAGTDTSDYNYRGQGPYSEPEARNMGDLMAAEQITVAISNHTPDARVLRVPSAPNEPRPADEAAYDGLGRQLAAHTGWKEGPWPDVYYDASGTTEETGYYMTGTYAFTFENMPGFDGVYAFHPPFAYVVDQYYGTGFYKGSNVREAFLTAFEAAADRGRHSVITGRAPAGRTLTITKDFMVDTSAPAAHIPTHLHSSMRVPLSGHFTWDVNPSLRPSQYASAELPESWTLTCSLFGIARQRSR